MGAAYSFYDEWLEPRVNKLETIISPECEVCSYKAQFNREGISAVALALDERAVTKGLNYAIIDGINISAGNIKWVNKNKDKIKQRIEALSKKASNTNNAVPHILWRDVHAGIAMSYLKLDRSHTLYIEEYLKVKPKSSLTSESQQVLKDNIRGITSQIVLFGLLLLLLGFVATAIIAGKVYQKLNSINQTADHIIKHQDLGQRIKHSGGNNEFDHLASNLNIMLGKIEEKVEDIKQMSNNIAHDLRTPLTSLHNKIEDVELDEAVASDLTQQVDRIICTFDSLLRVSHLETGNACITKEAVNLKQVISDLIDLFQPLAGEKGQLITMKLELASIEADVNLIFQALGNLLENAIKYAHAGSIITISAISEDHRSIISVQDEGSGVPDDKLEQVIQRFVRLDKTRNSPGNGLGLSMVNAIARAHDGSLQLKNLSKGFLVSIYLP